MPAETPYAHHVSVHGYYGEPSWIKWIQYQTTSSSIEKVLIEVQGRWQSSCWSLGVTRCHLMLWNAQKSDFSSEGKVSGPNRPDLSRPSHRSICPHIADSLSYPKIVFNCCLQGIVMGSSQSYTRSHPYTTGPLVYAGDNNGTLINVYIHKGAPCVYPPPD